MIGLRQYATPSTVALSFPLSNQRCSRRCLNRAPFFRLGRIKLNSSETNVRLFPTHASEFCHAAGGYERKLEKEKGFMPFPLRSESFRYLDDLVIRKYTVTFFFYTFRQRATRYLKRF